MRLKAFCMESDLIGAVQLSSFSRVLLLMCALTLSTAAHAQDSDLNNEQNNGVTLTAGSLPLEVVSVTSKSLQNSLLGRESYYAKNLDELYQVIGEKLAPVFDMRYVGYLVLGDYWKAADDLQRDRFVAAFSDFLIKTYAKGLLNFNQEQLVVFPATYSKDKKRAEVKTALRMNDGSIVPVDYRLRRSSEGWRVYDVRIEGVSYIQNYRSQINAEISALGLDAVILRLEQGAQESALTPVADDDS